MDAIPPSHSPHNTNRRAKVHKKQPFMTPSLRFPLKSGGNEWARFSVPLAKQGGTEPMHGAPREAGGTEWARFSVPLAKQGEPNGRATRFPSRSGGNLQEGGNCKLCPCGWYKALSHEFTWHGRPIETGRKV